MEIIISEKNILRTYSENSQIRAEQYKDVLKIRTFKNRMGSSNISKQFNIPEARIKNWIYESKKPQCLHTIDFLKNNNLIPLPMDENSQRFLFLVRMFAFCLGDGHIEGYGNDITRFILYGEEEDLRVIKEELKKYCNINSVIEKNTPPGNLSYKLKPCNEGGAAFARLMVAMGAPVGDKIITKFLLPEWLISSSNKILSHFLGVLLANELHTPKIRGNGVDCIRFSMNKHSRYIESGISFINQIKFLLNKFGIETTRTDITPSDRIRKDGLSYVTYFRIKNSRINALRFYNNIYLYYANEKQKKFENLASMIKTELKKELIKIEKYRIAIQMKQNYGIGFIRIGSFLNENKYTIRNWINYNKQPMYFNNEKEIKGLME